MNDYSQPEFYRFNEDSLKLVQRIKDSGVKATAVLDLGAGCGVLGIEVANQLGCESLTLLEPQVDFYSHLETNLAHQIKVPLKAEIIKAFFGEWTPEKKYDLIVCNPPYYLPGRGQPYKDARRELARSFIKDDWRILLKLIEKALTPEGKAFIVIKNDLFILKEIIKNSDTLCVSPYPEQDLIYLEIYCPRVDENEF